jgi:hypothetical protein
MLSQKLSTDAIFMIKAKKSKRKKKEKFINLLFFLQPEMLPDFSTSPKKPEHSCLFGVFFSWSFALLCSFSQENNA